MKNLLLSLLLILIPSAAFALEIMEGTDGPDVVFGDLGDFQGMPLDGSESVWETLNGLGDAALSAIGERLEGRIEGPLDNDDLIFGRGGRDVIFGQGGNDRIDGGPGEDMIFAGSGNDIIAYDPADRFVEGGSGLDILVGPAGSPGLREILEEGNTRSIEALLRCDSWTPDKDVPGLRIRDGRIIPDPGFWKPSGRDSEIASYSSLDGKMSLEILSPQAQ